MIIIYAGFIIKGLIQGILIYISSNNTDTAKISLSTMNIILTLIYYIAIIAAYVLYRSRPDECFMCKRILINL